MHLSPIIDISSLDAGTRAKALNLMLNAAEAAATLEVHYLVSVTLSYDIVVLCFEAWPIESF